MTPPVEPRAIPVWTRTGKVPCLDGLRALAIGLVIFSHLGLGTGPKPLVGFKGGHLGVTLFFAISGFLVTLLLLREHEASGRISLRGFYTRRVLRIFPAYYVYMLIGLVLAALGFVRVDASHWAAALLYVMCYMPGLNGAWHIGHSWSLSVEEHFYFLWPLALLAATPARAWRVALAYLLAAPFLRYGVWKLHLNWLDIDFCSLTQMSSISAGCVLAFVVRDQAFPALGASLRRRPLTWTAAGIALLSLSLLATRSGMYSIAMVDPVNAVACCLIIGGLVHTDGGPVAGLLENRVFTFIGVLSYSLYLWQQPFSNEGLFGTQIPGYLRLGAAFLVALASHYLVERPFLRLKERMRAPLPAAPPVAEPPR